MKVLILNYEYPPIGGGGGVISQQIANGLAVNHQVMVLTTWYPGLKEEEVVSGVRIVRVKSKRKNSFRSGPIEMLSWIRHSKQAATQLCKEEKFDICFANFVLPGGEVAFYLKRKFNVPYVLLSHGHDIPWVKPYRTLIPLHALSYFRLKRICSEAEKVFVQTKMMKENAIRFLGKKDKKAVTVIPNGCGVANSDVERSRDTLKVIFVGRLVRQKAPMDFLQAIELFSQHSREFEVEVYGDGPYRKKMERFVTGAGLQSNVRFFGKVPQEEVLKSYATSHVMIAPSESEGMSISMLEALGSGVYLITTNISGAVDMIEPKLNGDIVPYGNPVAIAECLESYWNHKFSHGYKIPNSYLKEFHAKFSWENIIDKYDVELSNIIEVQGAPIRVLHVIDHLGLGGAQTLLKSILSSEEEGLEARVMALRETDLCSIEDKDRIRIYSSGSRWSVLPIFAVRNEIIKYNISVLHCHLPRSLVFGYLIKQFLKPDLKLVFHEHGDVYEEGWLLPRLLKGFENKVDVFLACSEAVRIRLMEHARIEQKKIQVLQNCWEVSNTTAVTQGSNFTGNEPFIVGFVGRLVQRKGWLDFLKVAQHLTQDKSDMKFKFLMAGDGPDRNLILAKIEEMQLKDLVSMLGYVEDMGAFYSQLDCCIIPSAWEGLPLVQLEAMASGVAIITYDTPGLNEITSADKDALVVPLGNTWVLAEQVQRLYSDENLLFDLQSAGIQTANNYNSTGYNKRLLTSYKGLI